MPGGNAYGHEAISDSNDSRQEPYQRPAPCLAETRERPLLNVVWWRIQLELDFRPIKHPAVRETLRYAQVRWMS